jgi:predicted O-linked N-acetylglucosamine transferase (SPINDLY family)
MPVRTAEPARGRKLRIGYVSPDFRRNVASYFFVPLLAVLDRARFEIFCYATHRQSLSDDTTEHLQAMADHWRFVDTVNDNDLARLIHEDAIDILVELAGHLKGNRLKAFTYRPAPVQASCLGFIAATGLEAMDYWITDEVLHPADTPEKTVVIFDLYLPASHHSC